ncbi:hypothetical protein Hanom_Chr09g00770281 [Helianthus anomalus]
MILLFKINLTCLGFSLLCRQIQITFHHQKSIIGLNLLSIVVGPYSWGTMVKQEQRFMLKLSRMSMMVNLREMMTVWDTAGVQMKNVQTQARMDQKVHRERLLILRQMG